MVTALYEKPANRYRALVVDDSRIARNVLARLLTRLGYDVDAAHSAESALKQLAGALPDVVFMDHALPGMDGLEAVRRLRGQPRTARLPIVMYTSQESDAFARRADAAGADAVYPKSAGDSVLRDILTRLELVPVRPSTTSARREPAEGKQPAVGPRKITRADLVKLLEPSLAAHHAKLHQDLLAEFVILERYEERMRGELFARVDALTNRATDRLDRSFAERRREHERERQRSGRRWWGMAAAVTIAVGASLAISWTIAQQNFRLELQNASMLAALGAQDQAISELGTNLLELRPLYDGALAATTPAVGATDATTSVPATDETPTAAASLVAELQSMGILGPVRIETSAGSFCVTSTAQGFRLEVSNLALEDCEALPWRLTATNW